jgi:histidyl-tRNA synthetase
VLFRSFRAENPQKGRFREHHQFGVEFIGSLEPEADVEVICVGREVLNRVGINAKLHINSIGQKEARENYHNLLKNYIGDNINSMCKDCKDRFERNPLRSLDCKEKACKDIMKNAPSILDSLTDEDRAHFNSVLRILDSLGIEYVVDPKVVRGLDYYTRTVFEFIADADGDGKPLTVCGGGRYDNVIEQTGGPNMGSVGFGMGMERLLICLSDMNKLPDLKPRREIFVGFLGENGRLESQKVVYNLRKNGILADSDILARSLKAQMKYADKLGSKYSVVLGDSEIENGVCNIKNMDTGDSVEIKIDGILEFLRKE